MYFVVHYDLVIRTDPRAIGRFKLFTISSYYSHDCFDQNTFCVFEKNETSNLLCV